MILLNIHLRSLFLIVYNKDSYVLTLSKQYIINSTSSSIIFLLLVQMPIHGRAKKKKKEGKNELYLFMLSNGWANIYLSCNSDSWDVIARKCSSSGSSSPLGKKKTKKVN